MSYDFVTTTTRSENVYMSTLEEYACMLQGD